MASGAWQDGAGNKTSVVALPSDILQHIYSFFEDPTDVTSCHMVDTRFCAAARAALTSAKPQHPGFLELALQHRYPLRHLGIADLPFCNLDAYLAKAPESLTSLDIGHRTLEDWGLEDEEGHVLPNTHVLRGFFGLRSLSCHVEDFTLAFSQPELAGLHSLTITSEDYDPEADYQGLTHLTCLTQLWMDTDQAMGCPLLKTVAKLTTLRVLKLPTIYEWPMPSPLSALSHLTALGVGYLPDGGDEYGMNDEETAALVHALPQLRGFGARIFDAIGHLSSLQGLQCLDLIGNFDSCDLRAAALHTMADLKTLSIYSCCVGTDDALASVARITSLTALELDGAAPLGTTSSAIIDMLRALGPRLQRLSVCAGTYFTDADNLDVLVPAILAHCPVLVKLNAENLGPGTTVVDLTTAQLTRCSQLHIFYRAKVAKVGPRLHIGHKMLAQDQLFCTPASLLLSRVPMLRRLELCVRLTPSAVGCGLAPVVQGVTAGAVGHHLPVQHPGFRHNAGLHFLPCLERLRIKLTGAISGSSVHRMLEAVATCSRLTWLELAEPKEHGHRSTPEMRVLTGLFRLTVLDLRRMNWAEDGLRMGLTLLATHLPHLRALDAPDEALAHAVVDTSAVEVANIYELRDPPHRRLRRRPRYGSVLKRHRWPWDG